MISESSEKRKVATQRKGDPTSYFRRLQVARHLSIAQELSIALRNSTKITTNHGAQECNITFLGRNYGISSVDQIPHHQQM